MIARFVSPLLAGLRALCVTLRARRSRIPAWMCLNVVTALLYAWYGDWLFFVIWLLPVVIKIVEVASERA